MRNIAHLMGKCSVTASLLVVFALMPFAASAVTVPTTDVAALIAQLQAQIAALQAQIQTLQAERGESAPPLTVLPTPPTTLPPVPLPPSCPTLSRTLYLGLRGDDVSGLQQFLRERGYFTYPNNTGYFGPATEQAVQAFQNEMRIVSSGDPETTGFGVVGKQTREVIRNAVGAECENVPPPPPPIPQPPPIPPKSASYHYQVVLQLVALNDQARGLDTANEQQNAQISALLTQSRYLMMNVSLTDSSETLVSKIESLIRLNRQAAMLNQQRAGTQLSLVFQQIATILDQLKNELAGTLKNLPPVVSGVSGPTQLAVGEQGTWTVNAYDPESGALSYSVIWGDEALNGYGAAVPQPSSFAQTATFTHSYAITGTYSPVFVVTDNTNQQAKTSISVNVSGKTTFGLRVISPNGGETLQRGESYSITWTQPTNTSLPFQQTFDISLVPYQTPCPAGLACILSLPMPYTIAKDYYNKELGDGIYPWIVGNVQEANRIINDGAYYIQVCRSGMSGTDNCDQSDSYFRITTLPTKPSITVTSPNGGEQWQAGSSQLIRWTSFLPASDSIGIIRLHNSAGVEITLLENTFNDGQEMVTLPQSLQPGTYTLEVKSLTSVIGASAPFSIVAPTTIEPVPAISIGKPAELAGYTPGFGKPSLITDGVMAPEGTGWTNSQYAVQLRAIGPSGNRITVDLGALYNISHIRVQADDNDTYRVDYSVDPFSSDRNIAEWKLLYDVPYSSGGGLRSRTRDVSGVSARYVRIYATGGDGSYSVSELMLYGTPITTQQPSITVLSPNGGEQWQLKSVQFVKWTGTDSQYPAGIEAYLDTEKGETVGKIYESGKGSIQWNTGELASLQTTEVYPGGEGTRIFYAQPGKYYVRLIDKITGKFDRSDGSFEILPENTVQAKFQVNGSSDSTMRTSNRTLSFSWNSVNATACSIFFQNSDSREPYFSTFVGQKLTPSGQLSYQIPFTDTRQYFISLICESNIGSASKDVTVVYAPQFTPLKVTVPNGGEVWERNDRLTDTLSGSKWQSITWTGGTNPNNADSVRAYLERRNADNTFTVMGRIHPFAFGSILWVVGIVSPLDCESPCSDRHQLVQPAQYYIRLVDKLTGEEDRSDSPFSIVVAPTQGTFAFSTNFFGFSYIQGDPISTAFTQQQLILFNISNTDVLYTLRVENQPAWLNTSYAQETLTSKPGTPTGVGVSVDPAGLAVGKYTTDLIIRGNFANSPKTIPITLNVLAPTATKSVSLSATPTSGQAPLTVSFTGTLANFPSCGNTITWTWGDNTSESMAESCAGVTNIFASRVITGSHTYQAAGTYTARLTVGGIPSNDVTITVTSAPTTQLSITVASPNGGENWEVGKTYPIMWTTTAFPSSAVVQIALYDTRYAAVEARGAAIVATLTNTGSYNWAVPQSLGQLSGGALGGASVYKIRAIVVDAALGSKFDESNGLFSIVAVSGGGGGGGSGEGSVTSASFSLETWSGTWVNENNVADANILNRRLAVRIADPYVYVQPFYKCGSGECGGSEERNVAQTSAIINNTISFVWTTSVTTTRYTLTLLSNTRLHAVSATNYSSGGRQFSYANDEYFTKSVAIAPSNQAGLANTLSAIQAILQRLSAYLAQ